jgi:serine protease 16
MADHFTHRFFDTWWMEDTINSVNRNFGGLNPSIYRIFLTHGEMDPIRSLGPSNDLNALSPVIVMSLQSHSRDMGSIDDTDYVVLQNTKRQVQQAIFDWIEYARYGEPAPPPPPSPPDFTTLWFNLPVDHFSTTDLRNWDIRYLLNDNVYRENGPIFIFIGGGEITSEWITRGNVFDVAQAQGGVLAALELRYFGQSRPTNDTSFENLQWLTLNQAVADIGRFANFMSQRYLEAPIIVWGSGVGGSLATWARQKYPNVIDGAWASSAPLDAFVEFTDYFPSVSRTINSIGGPECGQVIADAFQMIEEAFDAGDMSQIEERMRFCQPVDIGNGYEIARITNWMAWSIGAGFVSRASYPDIDEKCIIMRGLDQPQNPAVDAVDAFSRWFVDDYHRNMPCLQVNNEAYVSQYQDPAWGSFSTTSGLRQSYWLNCAQLGQFPVANGGQGHPFGTRFDLRFFRQWCADAFGSDM